MPFPQSYNHDCIVMGSNYPFDVKGNQKEKIIFSFGGN